MTQCLPFLCFLEYPTLHHYSWPTQSSKSWPTGSPRDQSVVRCPQWGAWALLDEMSCHCRPRQTHPLDGGGVFPFLMVEAFPLSFLVFWFYGIRNGESREKKDELVRLQFVLMIFLTFHFPKPASWAWHEAILYKGKNEAKINRYIPHGLGCHAL